MHTPQTRTKQPPTSFHPTNPSMDRPPSSRYSNPLTFSVAVMFLFYVLSVSLCLSSFSTCICVIFNPVGTFRTIANYLFYALGLSVLLTFLFVALTGVYFGSQASPESLRIQEIVNKTLVPGVHHEVAASQEAVDVPPRQETHHEVSVTQETVHAMPIQETHREVSAAQEIVQTSLTQESRREVSAPQTADRNPRLCEEIPASPEEMSDMAEKKDNAPEANAAKHTETASQDKATANLITARESKKIEKWINQTNLANTHALKGDDTDDEDPDEEIPEIVVWRRGDGGPLSETRSVSQDSDFQKALRVYMSKGFKCGGRQRRSGVSTPSEGTNEESDFQDLIRRMFKLHKAGEQKNGGRRKARSA